MKIKESTRKFYVKPRVTQVKLEIEEAVLEACKTSLIDENGKNTSGCNISKCRLTQGS